MTSDAKDGAGAGRGRRLSWRVALLIVGLFLVICASVVATDILSPRDRLGVNGDTEGRSGPSTTLHSGG